MTTKLYPNGLGGAIGDVLATCKPLWTSGNAWYVSSLSGIDAGGTAGQNRERPLATIQQAITNASDDDIIVCLAGHSQVGLTSAVAVGKRLTIVGEGTASGKPSVTFNTNTASAINAFSVTATNVEFRNIYFPTNITANAGAKILVSGTVSRFRTVGCYFETTANESNALVLSNGADQARIESCTFISTAGSLANQPGAALFGAGATLADLEITGSVFSGGAFGFFGAAIDLSGVTVSRLKGLSVSLLLGADAKLGSASTGYFNVQTSTGGSRVDWT